MRVAHLAMVAAIGLAAACAGTPGPQAAAPRSDNRTIVAADLQAATQTNLYDYIVAFRPRWLQGRGPTTLSGGTRMSIAVFLDNQNLGGPTQLRSLGLNGISSVRFYDASEAQTRFNVRDVGAVIQVITQR